MDASNDKMHHQSMKVLQMCSIDEYKQVLILFLDFGNQLLKLSKVSSDSEVLKFDPWRSALRLALVLQILLP